MSRVELSPGDLLMEILYGHLQCGLFALGPLFADSRPGTFLKGFRFGAVVWDLPFGNFRLGLFVWERSSGVCRFGNFRLRAVARKMLLQNC